MVPIRAFSKIPKQPFIPLRFRWCRGRALSNTPHFAQHLVAVVEPLDLAARVCLGVSRLRPRTRLRMVPPSPLVGGGAVTPHASRGYNKENSSGVTPGTAAYGVTPGAKTNAESVAEVRP